MSALHALIGSVCTAQPLHPPLFSVATPTLWSTGNVRDSQGNVAATLTSTTFERGRGRVDGFDAGRETAPRRGLEMRRKACCYVWFFYFFPSHLPHPTFTSRPRFCFSSCVLLLHPAPRNSRIPLRVDEVMLSCIQTLPSLCPFEGGGGLTTWKKKCGSMKGWKAFDPRYLKGSRGALRLHNKLFEDHLRRASSCRGACYAAPPQREDEEVGAPRESRVLTWSEPDLKVLISPPSPP